MNTFEIDGEEVLDGEVKSFGYSAHVALPKRWRGANVIDEMSSEIVDAVALSPWLPP